MEFDGLVKTEDSGTRDSSTDSSYKDTNRMSDTPQGSLSGVESMKYLTQATITDGTSEQSTNENTESEGKTMKKTSKKPLRENTVSIPIAIS